MEKFSEVGLRVLSDLKNTAQYLPAGIITGVIVLFIFSVWTAVSEKKSLLKVIFRRKSIPLFLMAVYGTVMIYKVFLSRELGAVSRVNLLFLGTWRGVGVLHYFIENIIMFIPMGVLLPLCFEQGKKWYLTVLFGCALSIWIECTQYLFSVGVMELDDVLMNTLGTFLGWLSWRYVHVRCGNSRRRSSR